MEGDGELIKQMKIKKGGNVGNSECPDTVAGTEGGQNIAELFIQSHENLYNSASSVAEMNDMKTLEGLICLTSRKTDGRIVKETVSKLKPRKTDVSGS